MFSVVDSKGSASPPLMKPTTVMLRVFTFYKDKTIINKASRIKSIELNLNGNSIMYLDDRGKINFTQRRFFFLL